MKKLILLALICITHSTKGQVSLQLKIFIEAFMTNGQMRAVLYNSNPILYAPTDCDSITVELHNPDAPYTTAAFVNTMLHTDGSALAVFPPSVLNNSYYIVIKHKNSIETWSNNPFTFTAPTVYFNFSNNGPIASVLICGQEWMTQNLDVDHYRNGDPIPKVTDPTQWANLTTGAYCYLDNDSATYAAIYGKLYNGYAVNDPRGLAPTGWHIPRFGEWRTLENCLGSPHVAGGKLKEAGITHWAAPNVEATNSSGFTALPGAGRWIDGRFTIVFPNYIPGSRGDWWCSKEIGSSSMSAIYLMNSVGESTLYFSGAPLIQQGLSVRCVRD